MSGVRRRRDGREHRERREGTCPGRAAVRPRVQRRDLSAALQLLNSKESNQDGRWQTDDREMTSAVKFLDGSRTLIASQLQPEDVVSVLQTSQALVLSAS